MQNAFANQLQDRRDRIFSAIQTGTVKPNSDAIRELAELTVALDAERTPVKPIVTARMTVTRALGNLTIIEVCEDATFSEFYRVYTQIGRRRSTKKLVRTANRNEGLKPFYAAHKLKPGLEALAMQWQGMPNVASVKIRIIKKRTYRKLLTAAPDALGMVTSTVNRLPERLSWMLGSSRTLEVSAR